MAHTITTRGLGLLGGTLALALIAATGCERVDREITTAEGDMKAVVDGSNQFAVDLHQVAAADGGNVFFSPFSITAALSMVYGGAEGDTEQQIADAMHVGIDEAAWHDNLGALADDLSGEKYRGYTLYTGNAVWGQRGENFRTEYLGVLEDAYHAPMEPVDFEANPEGARKEINRWVDQQTKGHIDELFKGGDITDRTKLVLSNAIYFKADWEDQFDPKSTRTRDFWITEETSVQAEIMHRTGNLRGADLEGLKVVELPYQDDEISLVLVVPDELDGLAELEAALTGAELDGWLAEVGSQYGTVGLPKLEMKLELPLKETLQELGIVDGFERDLADFSGVIDPSEMNGNWYLHKARHEAYVLVDETGTEAAAATGFSMGDDDDGDSFSCIADHPFLFLIRDQLTGTILFMGRVADPT